MVRVLCAAGAIVGSAGASVAQSLFFDDFEDGPSDAWGNERGEWVAEGGEYFATQPSNNPPTLSTLPYDVGDFDLVVDVRRIQDGGLWLHTDSAGANGVLLVMGGNNHSYPGFYWHAIHDGNFSGALNHSGEVFTLGQDYRLTVRVRGDVYGVYIDDDTEPAASFTTGDFPTGRVGLYDYTAGDLRFDNVRLGVPCAADFNGDGHLNIFDFLAFQTAFGNEDLEADLAPPFGVLNIFDFLAFQTAFGNGC